MDSLLKRVPNEGNDLIYYPGSVVPWHFTTGTIVASFFASLAGTLLTVELLHRKRTGKTWASRMQLLSCALSMGLVGIWCMHFIGNRSIVLAEGQDDLQMAYSPGYTALSCFLPVIGLSFAFYVAELRLKSAIARRFLDVVSGVFAGLSIVGMHYVGNLGATNYKLTYPAHYIVAACIIAICACAIAMALFFYCKEKWISAFWKRMVIASILAIAVCGMHFTASVGCTYQLKTISRTTAGQRDVSVIVAGLLCCLAAVFCLGMLYYDNHRTKALTSGAQEVILACAFFDQQGDIMVSNSGLWPSHKVTQRFAYRSFTEEFNTAHPTFLWIWKVAHNWESVTDLIGEMRSHLKRVNQLYNHGSNSGTASKSSSVYDDESLSDDSLLFREGFCGAAFELAERLHITLNDLGALFDDVIGTGTLPKNPRSQSAGMQTFEKGQQLVFARQLGEEDVEFFSARGYRFAPLNRVGQNIATTMQIPEVEFESRVNRIRQHAIQVSKLQPAKEGAYLVCFAMLAKIGRHFEVLVQQERRDQVPDVQLSIKPLDLTQLAYLSHYEGWSAENIMRTVSQKHALLPHLPEGEKLFVEMMYGALKRLAETVKEDWFVELVFNTRPIIARYGATPQHADTQVFAFTRLLDIHRAALQQPDRLTFVPLNFFRIRQQYYPGCSDQGKLRQAMHAEFGAVLTKRYEPKMEEGRKGRVAKAMEDRGFMARKHPLHGSREDSIHECDSSSERGLVGEEENPFEPSFTPAAGTKQLWGGILATTDTVIVETSKMSGTIEMKNMVPEVTATATRGNDNQEDKSFVDLLYEMAKARSALISKPSGITSKHSNVGSTACRPTPSNDKLAALPSNRQLQGPDRLVVGRHFATNLLPRKLTSSYLATR
ncbi:hypothetical protein H2203_005282 [Taxawa tesnikishii (nom. ined.)]|nr:hypothetical protein H2203_005145 [Dothideales sp. JES 119]KAJ9624474.1 hypothetical protein H2203_005209 [Dothideales sp. JES 119]KAJ9624547.1 hypothetical protein H2203_005282 [Dothideales sp. JES 119]